jgi:hypothetical protein
MGLDVQETSERTASYYLQYGTPGILCRKSQIEQIYRLVLQSLEE